MRSEPNLDLRLWLRLLAASNRIERHLSRRLETSFGTTLARFDLMAQLARRPEGQSLTDLSRRVMVTNGAITGLVQRLLADGLVERRSHPSDRRTSLVVLTELGRERFAEMAREHAGWVAELLVGLPACEKRDLYDQLAGLRRSLEIAIGDGEGSSRGGAGPR